MEYVLDVAAGLFFCNCLPHLLAGLLGERFPTPFTKPRGVARSTPSVNFLWGFTNLVIAICLARPFPGPGSSASITAFLGGFFLAGLWLSHHFGKVRAAGFQ